VRRSAFEKNYKASKRPQKMETATATSFSVPHPLPRFLHWTALIKGPIDTPYEGGIFKLSIRCGSDYPLSPPTITFDTKVFHPNVHFSKGDVCLDILKKEWSPAWGLQAACRAVLALLSDPDAESPLNCDVSADDDVFDIFIHNYLPSHLVSTLSITSGREYGKGWR